MLLGGGWVIWQEGGSYSFDKILDVPLASDVLYLNYRNLLSHQLLSVLLPPEFLIYL